MASDNGPEMPRLPKRRASYHVPEDSEAESKSRVCKTATDIFYLFCIFVMLAWPWAFFGTVWALDGIPMTTGVANFVTAHPHSTNFFFVTFLGTVVRLMVGYLFSKAVLRFCQEWMMDHHLNLFHISIISGLRNQKLPWGLGDFWHLRRQSKWSRLALVAACWGTFIVVPSGVTSLLGPVPFDRTVSVEGTELDFSSTSADCIAWLNTQTIPNTCDWETYKGVNYTTCLGENQLVDVLESGRANILSMLTNNTQTIDYGQLGASGLKFLGPIRGVLPIGPNGVPAFDTLTSSPLSDPNMAPRIISYNYTLYTQGLNSNVSCEYAPLSPVQAYGLVPVNSFAIQYNGSCEGFGQADVLTNVPQFITPNSNNGLMFWACKSPPSAPELSYFIYLSGRVNYATAFGNITCTVSPVQPAIFPLTYQSVQNVFSSAAPAVSDATDFSGFIDQSVTAFGGLVEEAQSQQSNLVVESVISFGAKYYNLPEGNRDPRYLPLYQAMVQGVIEYLATYARFLISTGVDRPASCNRTLTGTFTYRVLGWSVKLEHIGFLLPITIVNLASFFIMILAIIGTKPVSYDSDPLDPKALVLAEHYFDTNDVEGWKDRVTYRDRSNRADEPETKAESSSLSQK